MKDRELHVAACTEERVRAQIEALDRVVFERTRALHEANRALKAEMALRARMETELRIAQKLEAVGQLSAGIAHEINTPIQFVGDSVDFLRRSSDDLLGLLRVYREVIDDLLAQQPSPKIRKHLAQAEEDADLSFLLEQIPKAFGRCEKGVNRVAVIVAAMKEFAHPDTAEMIEADLNRAIEVTVEVSKSETKYVADVELELEPIPLVTCNLGSLNQVLVNLIVNAAHAIGDKLADADGQIGAKGTIRICSHPEDFNVVITVADDGCGMPDDVRARMYDPFFTTKAVGRGTGQGMGLVRRVIDQHQGRIDCRSTVGVGTTFEITVPVAGPTGVSSS